MLHVMVGLLRGSPLESLWDTSLAIVFHKVVKVHIHKWKTCTIIHHLIIHWGLVVGGHTTALTTSVSPTSN